MELDSFLATPRWEILQIITQKPSSPMEIAEQTGTTISFASQQLKLLEATGLIKKQRTGASEKGKPRTLFSLSEESVYLIPLAKNITEKKLLPLSKEHKIILKIWSLEDKKIHNILERFFWLIQPFLEKIEAISVYTKNFTPKFYIISKDVSLNQQLNEIQKNVDEKTPFQVVSSVSSLSKLEIEKLVSIYEPEGNSSTETNSMKGGLSNDE